MLAIRPKTGEIACYYQYTPNDLYDVDGTDENVLADIQVGGQLRKVMVVIKMRGANHSKDIREYIITDKGVVIIHPRRTDYYGLITGIPERTGPRKEQETEPAPEPKATK